ncbi:hypothetical protein H7Q97_20140 [Ochrobactrum sp. CM-21-5]|nr:hypothetical protein [Ochrobactrum sp. CM-21-5]MBC2887691.1 hypothetical protein [Ochrobactrum sp. CM-21-5]
MTEWYGHVAARPALYAFGTKPGILPVSAHAGYDRTRASRFAAQQKFNNRIGYLLFTRPGDFSIVRQSRATGIGADVLLALGVNHLGAVLRANRSAPSLFDNQIMNDDRQSGRLWFRQ